jgi:hypothetical protein
MGIRLSAVANRRFRLVTHYWISEEDVTTVIKALKKFWLLDGESLKRGLEPF